MRWWESTRSILVNAANDKCNMRFVYIALLSMALDLLVFQVLFALGANLELAQITSFLAGAILSFALNADGGASELKHSSIRWTRFLLVALLALLMRSAVLMLVVGSWHWQPQTAIFVAIPMATVVFQVGAVFFIYLQSDASENPAIRWSVITISVVAYVLILKLIFMGCVNLIPEEAYYWNYAQSFGLGLPRSSTHGCLADLAFYTSIRQIRSFPFVCPLMSPGSSRHSSCFVSP